LGIITDSWVRLQTRPVYRTSVSVKFKDILQAARAVRAISQSGLFPTNCRVLDQMEALQNGAGDGSHALLLLGFESADHPLDAWMHRALELASDHGGRYAPKAVKQSITTSETSETPQPSRDAATGAWRNAFIRMPYYRDEYLRRGVLFDTFETAITWDKFEDFHAGVTERVSKAILETCGRPGYFSCRFTHIYPDGPAPYYTFGAYGSATDDLASALARWQYIKAAANEAVTALGGTATHHHAIGRDHRSGYERQTMPLFRDTLRGMKDTLDPKGILNPGVLYDPSNREVGITGVMGA